MIVARTVLAALLALAATPAAAQMMEVAAAEERLIVPDIPVTDRNGTIDGFVSRLAGEGTLLVSFSYTGCVSLCPVTHAILGLVDDALAKPGAPPLTIVTVSIDPANDTPAALDAAAERLRASRNWRWLVASPSDTPALLASFGVPLGPPEAHDPLFLVGDLASGRFRRISGFPDPDLLLDFARAGL